MKTTIKHVSLGDLDQTLVGVSILFTLTGPWRLKPEQVHEIRQFGVLLSEISGKDNKNYDKYLLTSRNDLHEITVLGEDEYANNFSITINRIKNV